MAKCDICEKAKFFGRKIAITRSQISRRGKRIQSANVKRVRVLDNGVPKTMHVCTNCLRSGAVTRG